MRLPRWFRDEHGWVTGLGVVVAVLIATAVLTALVLLGFALWGSDPANPTDNEHAAQCVRDHGTVQTHEQSGYGGKWLVVHHTYWCDQHGRITDLWWSD